jgi:hypothetical protein
VHYHEPDTRRILFCTKLPNFYGKHKVDSVIPQGISFGHPLFPSI